MHVIHPDFQAMTRHTAYALYKMLYCLDKGRHLMHMCGAAVDHTLPNLPVHIHELIVVGETSERLT